jgi:hypothetical protein
MTDYLSEIAPEPSAGRPAELDVPDLRERFRLLKERLAVLNERLAQRRATAERFRERTATSLGYLSADLGQHQRTWQMVENNQAASQRRTFLQGELLRLQGELYETELRELEKAVELERERDQLLLEYVQLKRVVEALP